MMNNTKEFTNETSRTSCYYTTIPVDVRFFNATVDDMRRVQLHWLTTAEMDISHFEIERSADGWVFGELLQIPAVGDSMMETSYSAIDERPLPGVAYYRLKQVDLDGSCTYHEMVSVKLEYGPNPKVQARVYPNPATDYCQLELSSSELLPVRFRLMTQDSRVVREASLNLNNGLNRQEISLTGLPSGLYFGEILLTEQTRRLAHFPVVIVSS